MKSFDVSCIASKRLSEELYALWEGEKKKTNFDEGISQGKEKKRGGN